ncbi:hypothetical protein [Nocardia sp. NPDC004860]|uniref:hypothetical protein n=1 Tax=Nocardia sp. NPDC004860 TaxID=3154557 RepID=UPI0033A89BF0
MVVVAGLSGESYDVDNEPFYTAGSRSVQYLCRDPRGQQRLYKLYRTPVTGPDAIESARQAMLFGRQTVLAAEAAGGSTGDAAEAVNWPIDLVLHEGMLAGTVLPLIPMDFLQPDGRPRTLDQLWAAPGQVASYFRAGLAIRLSDIARVLEERQFAHGDLSAKNVLWQPAAPLAYVIDTAGPATPDAAHDRFKDRYDLAVLVYRTLLPDAGAGAPGASWQPSGVPADLDPRVRALFDRAFGNGGFGPDARPAATEWSDTLRAVYLTPDGANYVPEALAVLDRHAGQPASAPAVPTVAFGSPTTPSPPSGWSMPQQPVAYSTAPQSSSANTALKVILGVLLVVLVIAIAVGAVVLTGKDSNKNSAAGTSTTTTVTTTAPPTSTTAGFDKNTLNKQSTDKTPFTADALLPQSFTDSKGVVFTRRSFGPKDCVSSNMSQNVKTALQNNKCQQMMTGVYLDASEKILTSIEVFAFPSNTEAETLYNGLKGQDQIWDVWCPTQGVGSSVCQANTDTLFKATYSSWGSQEYRYLYESYSLYINLTVDASLEPNLEASARTILNLVGPDNYWKDR